MLSCSRKQKRQKWWKQRNLPTISILVNMRNTDGFHEWLPRVWRAGLQIAKFGSVRHELRQACVVIKRHWKNFFWVFVLLDDFNEGKISLFIKLSKLLFFRYR